MVLIKMKKWFFIFLMIMIGTGCSFWDIDEDKNRDGSNQVISKDMQCEKHMEKIICGKDIDPYGVQGTWEAIVEADFHYIGYAPPKHKTDCLKREGLNGVHNFFPRKGKGAWEGVKSLEKIYTEELIRSLEPLLKAEEECHSDDDKCLKAKEDWKEKRLKAGFECRFKEIEFKQLEDLDSTDSFSK